VKAAAAIATLLAAGAARADLPEQFRTPKARPPRAQGVDVEERLGQPLPRDLGFRDESGRLVTLGDALSGGKPVFLTLVYFECPMLCNLLLQGFQQGLRRAELRPGIDYRGVTVSIDPREGPDRAHRHQTAMLRTLQAGAPADWPFLTGQEPEIQRLADAVGYRYRYDEATRQYAHPAVAFVITPDGRISRYLYGVEFAPRDLRLAAVEAAGGKVGTTLDRVLLSCFRWDPATRKYEVYLFAMVRGGASIVFVALATLLFVLWRRDLRRQRAEGAARTTP
jgi:protein SCO1/2